MQRGPTTDASFRCTGRWYGKLDDDPESGISPKPPPITRGNGSTIKVSLAITFLFVSILIGSVVVATMTYLRSTTPSQQVSPPPPTQALVHRSEIVTYRFDMERGFAFTPEDTNNIHMQRVPQRGGIYGITVGDVMDIAIVCTMVGEDGAVAIYRHPWTDHPPEIKKEGWMAWYNVYADGGGGIFLVISSYAVQDELYSTSLPCNLVFTVA